MSTWTDSRCGKSWGGLKAEHCPECHETFTGTLAGDKHRTRDFKCLHPLDAGLVKRTNGIWGLPISSEDRERLAALGRRKPDRPDPAPESAPGAPDSPSPVSAGPPTLPNPAEARTEVRA